MSIEDSPEKKFPTFADMASSPRLAGLIESLNKSQKLLRNLEEEGEKKWDSYVAAIACFMERALANNLMDQAKLYPGSEEAQKDGQALLDQPTSDLALIGIRRLLPKEFQPQPSPEEKVVLPESPGGRLWSEVLKLREFSSTPLFLFNRALAYTLEGEGLNKNDLLSAAFEGEPDNEREGSRRSQMFGPLKRSANSTFLRADHEVFSYLHTKKSEKGDITEKRYKVRPITVQSREAGEKTNPEGD